jgi:hypothetical protein
VLRGRAPTTRGAEDDIGIRVGVGISVGVAVRVRVGVGVGIAMEGGGARFRWDLSRPLVGAMSDRGKDCVGCFEVQPYMPIFAEAGISAALGDHDLLRLGTSSYAPNVSYQHIAASWFLASTLYIVPAYRFSEIVSLSGGIRL